MKYLLDGQETERLKFRLLERTDFENWRPLFEVKQAAEFLALDPTKSPVELCQSWFQKIFHRYENDLGGMNVLVDKITGRMIGQCGLLIQDVEGEQRMEIGYSILPEFWGNGFASEASQKCKDHAFENDFSGSLISMVHVDNIASEKVARKNGMQLEKTLTDYKGCHANMFSIDKKEWLLEKAI